MSDMLPVDDIADNMYKMIKSATGLKKYKAMDLHKGIKEMFPGRVDRTSLKAGIKQLIDSGKCVYTYFGGSYIELPHVEGAANPDPEA